MKTRTSFLGFLLLVAITFSQTIQAQYNCIVSNNQQARCNAYGTTKGWCPMPKGYAPSDTTNISGGFLDSYCSNDCVQSFGIGQDNNGNDCATAMIMEGNGNDTIREYGKPHMPEATPIEVVSTNEDTELYKKEVLDFSEEIQAYEKEDFSAVGFNEFKINDWMNDTSVAKIVDPYGIERYTSDGKNFYDSQYKAAHSQEGMSNMANKASNTWDNFWDFFSFKTKSKDKDKALQGEIAQEVLKDSKGQREKDIEKAYEKISGAIKTPMGGGVPAAVIVTAMEGAKISDFSGAAMIYIDARKAGDSMAVIRENSSEVLTGGYGTLKAEGGASVSTTNKQAQGVLYARYEEVYQRYLLAKELGRTE